MATYSLQIADNPIFFEDARKLFVEYAQSLGFDLCFQGFDRELDTLAVQYNKPNGALILAYTYEGAVGCVGLRELEPRTAELKRMYVKKNHRKSGIGVSLLEAILAKATELGYERIRLDTLSDMQAAYSLYRKFGFYEIPPYRFNPIEGARYMEKMLDTPSAVLP